jgi:hypothetical protein
VCNIESEINIQWHKQRMVMHGLVISRMVSPWQDLWKFCALETVCVRFYYPKRRISIFDALTLLVHTQQSLHIGCSLIDLSLFNIGDGYGLEVLGTW